jgi:Ca-activated chloride channel homolog
MSTARIVLGLSCVLTMTCGGVTTPPPARDPGVVLFEGDLGNRYVKAGDPTQVLARLRVGTRTVTGRRPAINLGVVIDTSGSMEGGPIADARTAAAALLDALRPGDRLSVVTFDSRTEVLLPSTILDEANIATVRRRLTGIRARGTTDMAGGLRAGVEEVVRNFQAGGINRVVLLGDGVPNDEAPLRAMAQAAGERGISVTALGLGSDYDETVMAAVAQLSGGTFRFIQESSAMAGVFRNEVLRLERVFARNATVTLTPGPGVRIDSVVGQQVSQVGGNVVVTVGDVSQAESLDLVVKMTTDGHRDGSAVELLDAVLGFDDAFAEGGRFERRVYLGARATASEQTRASGRNQEVEAAAERVQAAALTVEAIRIARDGELDRARAMLAQAAAEADAVAAATDNRAQASQASEYRSLSGALGSVAPAPVAPPATSVRESPARGGGAAAEVRGDRAPTVDDALRLRRIHDEAQRTLQVH